MKAAVKPRVKTVKTNDEHLEDARSFGYLIARTPDNGDKNECVVDGYDKLNDAVDAANDRLTEHDDEVVVVYKAVKIVRRTKPPIETINLK